MGNLKRLVDWVIVTLLLMIMLTSLMAMPHSNAGVFIFTWEISAEEVVPPYSTTFYHDIYYDPYNHLGFITFQSLNFLGNQIDFSYANFWPDATGFSFNSFESSQINPFAYMSSTFYPRTTSIYLTGWKYIASNLGIHQIRPYEAQFIFNAIPYSEILDTGTDILALEVNQVTSQIILLTSNNQVGAAYVYDLKEEIWLETSGDVPGYTPSTGALSIDSVNNKAVYFIDRETDPNAEGKTYILDLKSREWKMKKTSTRPVSIADYSLIYYEAINHHVLIGGINTVTGEGNNNVWIFSTETNKWTKVFENLPILDASKNPKFYYDKDLFRMVGLGETADNDNTYILFSIDMDHIVDPSVKVDFGVPASIVLAIGGIILGSGIVTAVTILFIRRKSSFTPNPARDAL